MRVSDSRSTSRTKRPTPSLVFSATLPTKPSQTITSARPRKDVAPFDVAHKTDGQRLEQREGLVGQVVAFGFFFANIEQAHARRVDLQHGAGVNLAHHGKLRQIVGFAVDVGAHVQQHAGVALGAGHRRRQGGTVYAGQRAQHHLGRGHRRAGVAGGDKTGGLAVAHQFQADADGAVFLGAVGLRRLLFHADAFSGIVDDDGQVVVAQGFVQKIAQLRLRTHQVDPHGQSLASEDSPANLRFRSFVGAYGVKRNIDQHGREATWLLP